MNEPKLGADVSADTARFQRIGNEAVRQAQEDNRTLGIPNSFLRNGTIYYEMPDGTVTTENPFAEDGTPAKQQDDSHAAPDG